MASRKISMLLVAAASMAVAVGALLPVTARRPDNHVVGEQKWWSGPDTHEVGDADGWRLGVNYDDWATRNNNIPAGSTLHFFYDSASYNVVLVDENGYNNCVVPNNPQMWNSGDEFFLLDAVGTFHFICSMGNHCSQGMKLAITTI